MGSLGFHNTKLAKYTSSSISQLWVQKSAFRGSGWQDSGSVVSGDLGSVGTCPRLLIVLEK
eukprot:5930356-Amphidinium_carterae.1